MDGEWLREKIGEVVGALAPGDDELALANAIADPVETHVNGLRAVQFDCVIGHADGACIVAENVRCGLWIAEGRGDGS